VEVPVTGSPFKVTLPGVSVVFPQSLVVDPGSSSLFIGDGGDPAGVGQVVKVSADLSTATVVPIAGVTNPTGLTFDAAGDMYVLDGNANTISVVAGAQANGTVTLLPFDNTTLRSASAMAMSAGGQSIVIANIGAGTNNNLLFLNGNISTLNYGNVTVGQNKTLTATVNNIGNSDLTLAAPYYTSGNNNAFTIVNGAGSCGNGSVLALYGSCAINVKFAPQGQGASAHYLVVRSDGYNSGTPYIAAQGTGVAAPRIGRPHRRR
jgi:hypothetical protein